jgi:hypothetical protein
MDFDPTPKKKTDLFLHQSQLLEVTFKESHFLLLCFCVAVSNDIVILLLDFIQLNLKLNNLAQPIEH